MSTGRLTWRARTTSCWRRKAFSATNAAFVLVRSPLLLPAVYVAATPLRPVLTPGIPQHSAGGRTQHPVRMTSGARTACGYEHIADIHRMLPTENLYLRWNVGNCRLDLYLPHAAGEELFTGLAPANPASQLLSVAVRRRTSADHVFLAMFVPSRKGRIPAVRRVLWSHLEDRRAQLTVETPRRFEKWIIGPEPGRAELTIHRSAAGCEQRHAEAKPKGWAR